MLLYYSLLCGGLSPHNFIKMSKEELLAEIARLKEENDALRKDYASPTFSNTVKVPDKFKAVFDKAQKTVGKYFENIKASPEKGTIEIQGQRYVLVRASSLSHEFLQAIRNLYSDRDDKEALLIGNNFLFDIAHVIGLEDAKNFHKRMNLTEPLEKLSAGPVHFAYTGWAFVDILPESSPSPDDDFFLKYDHPFSFEADSWMRNNKKSDSPVCIMNAGYSSGWCEASFDIPLTSVEISCKARGDEKCTFIMAPPHRIEEYLEKEFIEHEAGNIAIPAFFERKKVEEQLKSSLKEKEALLKEIHHRVKNNLQIISSLLNLQSHYVKDNDSKEKFRESINRIKAIALIHETLYGSKNLSNINIEGYIGVVVESLQKIYSIEDKNISVEIEFNLKSRFLKLEKAMPCGLILNELISNCFKYAFPDNRKGKVKVSLSDNGKKAAHLKYTLIVADNGIGFPDNLDINNTNSLGLELVNTLVSQIDGEIELDKTDGAKFLIRF